MSRDQSTPDRRVIVTTLGLTQIMAWGSSYYLPAVIGPAVSARTGWPFPWVIGSLSLGLLVAGLISPHVGAAIERHGGRMTLAFSAVCLGIGQAVLAASPNLPVFVTGWLIMGFGMGAGLYDAAFGTLGRLYGRGARSTITSLTLFGGFASTVCWPISALLLDAFGWRGVCLAYAAIQLLVALPAYLLVLPRGVPAEPPVAAATGPEAGLAPRGLPLMATLAASITLSAVISSTLSVHLLTVLQSTGLALAAAVGLGALVGPSQVGARAVEMAIARYHHPIWTKLASVTFVIFGVAALWTGLPMLPVALALYGAGIGLESIARGTLPLALFGAPGYAKLMGRLAMPSLIAQAAAPSLGALLLEHVGASGLLSVLLGLALVNVLLVAALLAFKRNSSRPVRTIVPS
ncbi:MFS transporter [Mesorhizobium opportunistum]|uniref:Major facilitator superfamily MFS_1 n=1 Tax=Mesorhizobium opportunistum (strain LMG 24607 / HAMBI 3007 / WSM2075) TaxID=536019 RepID=F7Y7U9_MESOW|nr:MFS transporter [Mesorhizobium opportunistum]AEH85268.1 major facilitator superfamily MFS_1 [Mesorhizobium opportunistum WSM2075]